MKQFNYEFTNVSEIEKALIEISDYTSTHNYNSILIHLYTIAFTPTQIHDIQYYIRDYLPDAFICGTSTNGDICDGHLADSGLVMAVSIFESTDINIKVFECEPGQEIPVGTAIKEFINKVSNIVAAEILITLKSIDSHKILNEVEKCSKDIQIFGGGSASADISSDDTFIITNATTLAKGVQVITYSGNDLHIDIHHAIGWKPLGKDLKVTKIDGKLLYELNNTPAGKVYSRYLDIQPDESFFSNILEFPIMAHQHGFDVLRLPFECNNDDLSIRLAADVDLDSTVNLSYGDPDVIKSEVEKLENTVNAFNPEAIFLYSCGVRRLYWKYLINKETGPFNAIAPVCGFYSSGEIMRMNSYIIEHHVTLIAISMREGDHANVKPSGNGDKHIHVPAEQKMHNQISMVRRLANFINVTAAELQTANERLQQIADTDELTGLYNRRMLDKLMDTALQRAKLYNLDMTVGIIDIDDFKSINDTYGHDIGDQVLVSISSNMNQEIIKHPSCIFGRWGGEEFLFIAPLLKLEDVQDKIELARQRVSSKKLKDVGVVTLSLGLTSFKPNDTVESIFKRADDALYEAKNTGKNKTCVKY
ncbi:MAG: diguanylate cyclase [Pseudobutyrivibrio sp.]|nr:diguanylate cyclase [Pseudobutyrivibrio sp.]